MSNYPESEQFDYPMKGNIEIYQSEHHVVELIVSFDNDTVWLNQEQMASLFDRDRTVIGSHIRNIFNEEELIEDEVCADFAHTTQTRSTK